MAALKGHVEVVELLAEVASLAAVQDEEGGGPQLPVDLWPGCFVVGLPWWQPEFKIRCFHIDFC